MIRSTMSEFPLTINAIFRHGRRVHATSECVTFTGDGVRRASYAQVDWRAKTGRAVPGVELRIVDEDGHELPWDARAVGEDPRWDERPLACVVVEGSVEPAELETFLAGHVAKRQVPENWAFVDAIPKTSVGKFNKKALRTQFEKGGLAPERA